MDVAKLNMSGKKLNKVKAETYFMARVDAKIKSVKASAFETKIASLKAELDAMWRDWRDNLKWRYELHIKTILI